jgi:Flp pilus assembly protein TadD
MPPKKGKKGKGKAKVDKYAGVSQEERLAQSLVFKEKGNTAFSGKEFQAAVDAFTEAIAYDPANHVFYSNRSAAYLALEKGKQATADAKSCISVKPDW